MAVTAEVMGRKGCCWLLLAAAAGPANGLLLPRGCRWLLLLSRGCWLLLLPRGDAAPLCCHPGMTVTFPTHVPPALTTEFMAAGERDPGGGLPTPVSPALATCTEVMAAALWGPALRGSATVGACHSEACPVVWACHSVGLPIWSGIESQAARGHIP